MTLWFAVLAGASLGYVFERGDFCFHSTWRQAVASPPEFSLLRAYLLVLLITTPVVQILVAADVVQPFVPAFAWQATIAGGLVFALGMVVAKTCVTGMFYKLGHGMFGMVVALVAWVIGDLVTYRGPLQDLRQSLNDNPITAGDDQSVATVSSLFGPAGVLGVVAIAIGMAFLLMRAMRNGDALQNRGKLLGWFPLGIACSVVIIVAWLLARWHGFDYAFGTSGAPSQIWDRLGGDDVGSMWIPLALISLVPGALFAARRSGTFWARSESGRRFGELGAGGFLMGIGAGVAGGCNLGHALVGVPLLSLGSISATLSMIVGLIVFDRLIRAFQ